MNIFIGYDFSGKPCGIILAENKQLAWVVFEARGDKVKDIEEINPNQKDLGSNGVCYLLTSTEVSKHHLCDSRSVESVRVWHRGK